MVTSIQTQLAGRLAAFEQACRQRGLRVTRQRREIFKTVALSCAHPSAEEVFSQVRKTVANVSLDTVYRTLAALEKMDLLVRVGTAQKERFDGDMRPHAHFVCTVCSRVYDVFPPDVSCEVKTSALSCGEIKRVNIQFQGICKQCRG